jgi:phosphoribosylamine--glycine ligase
MTNVLLIGSGGREHALAWKLAQSPLLGRLIVAPGNPGTALLGTNAPLPTWDLEGIVSLARNERVDLVVVGPDNPLADGLVDRCRAAGLAAFGPTAAAARIESSKSFAKQLMSELGVPTPAFQVFDDAEEAAAFVRASRRAWVVKADGLALGKGVIVPPDVECTLAAVAQLAQLPAGARLLLEEPATGSELSLIALCDGRSLLSLPPARDYKRIGAGNSGANTGGMGAVAPVNIPAAVYEEIVERCMRPVVRALAERGTPFVGALYAGVMLTDQGPLVLEFNARFGDPETQALVPLLDGDLLAALLACAEGRLHEVDLGWRNGYAACVVLAAAGYPATPRLGDPISGLEALAGGDALVFHAGSAWQDGRLVTAGGRVLGVTGCGRSRRAALEQAYAAAETIHFEGMQLRPDIGLGR